MWASVDLYQQQSQWKMKNVGVLNRLHCFVPTDGAGVDMLKLGVVKLGTGSFWPLYVSMYARTHTVQ